MATRILAGLAAGLVLILATACGGAGASSAPTTAPASVATSAAPSAPPACTTDATEGEEVVIFEFKFDPADLTVPAGTAVAWTNGDSASHTVTFSDGPDCGTLAQSASVALEFDTPGTYSYFCRFHSSMRGTVTVQ